MPRLALVLMIAVVPLVACTQDDAAMRDDRDPRVAVQGLADGQTVAPDHGFTVVASDDGQLESLAVSVDGFPYQEVPIAARLGMMLPDLAAGSHELSVRATDASGRATVATVSFVVDEMAGDEALALEITNPAGGASVGPPDREQVDVTIGIGGTMPAGASVETVEVVVGAQRDGRTASRIESSAGPEHYVFSWNACTPSAGHDPSVNGDRTLAALVTLDSGETIVSPGVTVTFDGSECAAEA